MDAVEEVKQRLNIEDVIAQYVQLKRAGRNFKGLSPFTNEKTASFIVSPEKQIWHDFSSGKGGDVFTFVMEMEGLEFRPTLELLARQAGVDLTQFNSGSNENSKLKERCYEALELATKFYQTQLKESTLAQDYVKKRGINKETLLDFRIGYSPNTGDALTKFLTKRGFNEEELKKAGLVSGRGRILKDMFRQRLMIPLTDSTGRVVGYTARQLIEDKQSPKYINTSQTILYDKSRHVFGLDHAKAAIRQNDYAVIVEGNMDVIASHQVGVKQVVATAGTALTEYHLKALNRLSGNVRICFDQDEAGLKAMERSIPIASKVGANLQVVTVKGAKDPDELIHKNEAAWAKAIDEPTYATDWLIERYKKQFDLTSGHGKRQFSDQILPIIQGLADDVEQEHYMEQIAKLLGVSTAALKSKRDSTSSASERRLKTNKASGAVNSSDPNLLALRKMSNHLLAICLVAPELRQFTSTLNETMLVDPQAQSLMQYLIKNPDFDIREPLGKELLNLSDYIKILVLQYEELYGDLSELELQYETSRLQTKLIQQYVKVQKQKLVEQLANADQKQTATLLEQAKELDKLLKTSKGAN